MTPAEYPADGVGDFDCPVCACNLKVPDDLAKEEHCDLQCCNCGAELYVELVTYHTATEQ